MTKRIYIPMLVKTKVQLESIWGVDPRLQTVHCADPGFLGVMLVFDNEDSAKGWCDNYMKLDVEVTE